MIFLSDFSYHDLELFSSLTPIHDQQNGREKQEADLTRCEVTAPLADPLY